jgi:hypothetical protein
MTVVSHPPYSPDLTACVFFLLHRLKINLRGSHLDTIEAGLQVVLNTLTEHDFQNAF